MSFTYPVSATSSAILYDILHPGVDFLNLKTLTTFATSGKGCTLTYSMGLLKIVKENEKTVINTAIQLLVDYRSTTMEIIENLWKITYNWTEPPFSELGVKNISDTISNCYLGTLAFRNQNMSDSDIKDRVYLISKAVNESLRIHLNHEALEALDHELKCTDIESNWKKIKFRTNESMLKEAKEKIYDKESLHQDWDSSGQSLAFSVSEPIDIPDKSINNEREEAKTPVEPPKDGAGKEINDLLFTSPRFLSLRDMNTSTSIYLEDEELQSKST